MTKLNILNNFSTKSYSSYPFPHFEIKNTFNEAVTNQLLNDYKLFIKIFKNSNTYSENNKRLQLSANDFFKLEIFKKSIWYDFMSYHTSKEFFLDLLNIFSKDIKKYYPKFNLDLNNKNLLGIRSDFNSNFNKQYVIDCQPGINTPVTKATSVRGPHIDNPAELIGGLFYLRDTNDKSSGGDLLLYETKGKIYFKNKAEVQNIEKLKVYKKIDYSLNNCVFFLNTVDSIHSITPRSITDITRNLTNIIIENYKLPNGYFSIPRKNNFFKIVRGYLKNSINNFLK
jgi:hypothetical protein